MSSRWRNILVCLALALGTAALYAPASGFDFADDDDRDYVVENYHVNSGWSLAGLKWSFQAGYAANWHPLTWMSHMLDCQIYGVHAGGHHVTNIILHTLNAVLLFLLLQRMTSAPWRSAMVAALFAWHPLHVESVAWIAERKDVLSTFFWLLTIWSYFKFQISNLKSWYWAALFLYALAIMAKPMVVTLPFLLLLLDYWPLQRWRGTRSAIEKTPFFLLSACCCVATLVAQKRGGAIASLGAVSVHYRLYNTALSYWRYIGKLLAPMNLAVIYPISPGHRSILLAALAALSLIAVSCIAILLRGRRPYLTVGWFWYLGTLVPVIGIVQVGAQTMADRYAYVPALGLFILAVWTISDWALAGRYGRQLLGLAAALVLAACLYITAIQLKYWRNGETLFAHAIAVTPRNFEAHESYAEYLVAHDRWDDARRQCDAALEIWPEFGSAHFVLGKILYHERKYDQAVVEVSWGLPEAWNAVRAEEYLGRIALDRNQPKAAAVAFRKELGLNGFCPTAHWGLGEALAREGNRDAAAKEFQEALQLSPRDAEAKNGLARLQTGGALQP